MNPSTAPGAAGHGQGSGDAGAVLRLLGNRLKPLGFKRTKPTFFTRPAQLVIQFVHVHKFRFAPAFRIHLGVRVRSDDFPAAALNGPNSDELIDPTTLRNHRFDYTPGGDRLEACADAMFAFVVTHGLPWLMSSDHLPALLLHPGSPLTPSEKAALEKEAAHPDDAATSAATRKVLNVH